MAKFIIGSDIKFAIDLTAIGFSMDNDDFDITVKTGRDTITASKDSPSPDGKLVIFREPELSSSSDSSSSESSDSSDSSTGDEGTWFAILKTEGLINGDVYVIGTAHIPDAQAYGAIRNEKAKEKLGELVKE